MQFDNNSVIEILRRYSPDGCGPELDPSLVHRHLEHLDRRGLVPISCYCLKTTQASVSRELARELHAADLSARVIHGQLREAAKEILEIAARNDISVVLLKGIAISSEYYVDPHHRTMGDIDVLVSADQASSLQNLLIENGYHYPDDLKDFVRPDNHHHLAEIRHPSSNIAIEIHTSLFSTSTFATSPLFANENVWGFTERSTFHGRPCLRFQSEMLFTHALAHWAVDHNWPSNAINIVDLAMILRQEGDTLDWGLIGNWMNDDPLFEDSLAVILLFMWEAGICKMPALARDRVETAGKKIGSTNLRILFWLLYTFPISGRTKVAWALTQTNAHVLWSTLLERRPPWNRLPLAIGRILARRTPNMPLLASVASRIRTLLRPNA